MGNSTAIPIDDIDEPPAPLAYLVLCFGFNCVIQDCWRFILTRSEVEIPFCPTFVDVSSVSLDSVIHLKNRE